MRLILYRIWLITKYAYSRSYFALKRYTLSVYSNRIAFTGEILVITIEGIMSINKHIINVPILSVTIYPKFTYTGASVT